MNESGEPRLHHGLGREREDELPGRYPLRGVAARGRGDRYLGHGPIASSNPTRSQNSPKPGVFPSHLWCFLAGIPGTPGVFPVFCGKISCGMRGIFAFWGKMTRVLFCAFQKKGYISRKKYLFETLVPYILPPNALATSSGRGICNEETSDALPTRIYRAKTSIRFVWPTCRCF
jgi:hypothetical protein